MNRRAREVETAGTGPAFRPALKKALNHAVRHLENLTKARVSSSATLDALRGRLDRPLTDGGVDPATVVDDIVADASGGIVGSAGGRFFGWVIGGCLPAALAADWLVSAWDQNAAIHACGPAVAVMEEIAGKWLRDLLRLPDDAAFAFTTGTQFAHVAGLAAARHALLTKHDWDVERRGLPGSPPIRILCGEQRHGSVDRAVRLLGVGSDNIVGLPVDGHGRLARGPLAAALDGAPKTPTVVILQAGELNTGAFDPFAELIPLAHKHQAWVHVDGAFGLWANASPPYRHLLEGVELADSWAVDGHKWLNVPYDSGYAFVKDAQALREAMSHRTSYRTPVEGARDQIDWNPEWSRRARGVATYAAIRQLGRKGIADLIDRTCRHAQNLVARIGALPGAEIVWKPTINQGLVRFLSHGPGATEAEHDARTDAVIASIVSTGDAFFGGVTWRGMRCMRVSVCNWQTSDADIDRAVTAVHAALEA
jgi:glutamate/tyrosine decarboxylase-like PLP-dependent enzyme